MKKCIFMRKTTQNSTLPQPVVNGGNVNVKCTRVMSVEVARFGMRELRSLIPDVCGCHVLRILAVVVYRIGDIYCLPVPAHRPFSFNNLGFSALEEVCSRNVRASGTLTFGYEGIFKNNKICNFL